MPKQPYQSGEPFVFVDTVQADVSNYENGLLALKNRRSVAESDLLREYAATATGLADAFADAVADYEVELERRSVAAQRRQQLQGEVQELRGRIKQLQLLIDVEQRLTSEIRSRLVRCGIRQVERSDRAQQLIVNKVSGRNWIKPDSEDAVTSNLVQATHLLITDVRHPEQSSGRYQISMRLVDTLTGEIVWEDQGDRQELTSPASQTTATTASRWKSRKGKYPPLKGTWQTKKGALGTISEEDDGAVHAIFTTSDGVISFDVVARRAEDTITVESCTVTGHYGKKSAKADVAAELRIVDAGIVNFGCPTVSITSRAKLNIGEQVWSTFHQDE